MCFPLLKKKKKVFSFIKKRKKDGFSCVGSVLFIGLKGQIKGMEKVMKRFTGLA